MNRSSLQLFGRIALITVLVVLAIWLLRRFLPALAWAAVLAIASWPVRQWLIDKGVRRSTAAFLLTVLVGALIVGPLLVLAVQMAREAGVIVQGFRDLKEKLSTPEWVSQLPFVGGYLAAWWMDNLSDPDAAKELLSRTESFGLIGWGRSFGRCHGKRSCPRRISRGLRACTRLRGDRSEPSHSIRVCDSVSLISAISTSWCRRAFTQTAPTSSARPFETSWIAKTTQSSSP
jgi:hypothetical protein